MSGTSQSPANAGELPGGRKRVPMSLPKLRLEAPEIPGYHLHWFLDSRGGGRIQQALDAGFEFVSTDELDIPNTGVSEDVVKSGNEDMGTRVSRFGGVGENGQAEMLYLMKQKQEWWEEDQKLLQARNKQIEDAIRRKKVIIADGESPVDQANRYVKTSDLQVPSQPTKRRV